MNIDQFLELAKKRRAIRGFNEKPLDPALLEKVLDAARWAPSGYNLQPTHFVVVTDPALKKELQVACLFQKQVAQAAAVVVFAGDRKVYQNNLDKMIQSDVDAGAINTEYVGIVRKYVRLAFDQGPCGIGWLGKAIVGPVMRLMKPTPSIPAVHKSFWVTKQVMLTAMNFMLAAKAAGLDTVPMEGFDESRVKKILNIPPSLIVPVVIPIGYSDTSNAKKSRLPLKNMLHQNGW